MLFDQSKIKSVMKHRFPMLLVDAIISLREWDQVVGVKCITATDKCFAHLHDDCPPERYAYPPSLMIEAFGQACGVLVGLKRACDGRPWDELMLAAGLTGFEILKNANPGDRLEFRGQMVKEFTDFAVFDGSVLVDGAIIAQIDSMIVAFRRPGVIDRPKHEGSIDG